MYVHLSATQGLKEVDQNCAAASGTGTKSISSKVYY